MNKTQNLWLTQKAIKGNRKAYGELIQLHQIYLYKTAYMYVKNEHDALDAVQECVTKAMIAIDKLREPQHFKTWITRILIHCIYRSENKTMKEVAFEEILEVQDENKVSFEEKLDLYEAIDNLQHTYKTVIIFYYFHGMKIKEISKIMQIPEGSVKGYLHRAKAELKKSL